MGHKLCQVDLLVPMLNDRPPQIGLLLRGHHQEEGEEAMSRMLVQLLLLAHLGVPGAGFEMLAPAKTCSLLRRSMQPLQVFILNVLLRLVVVVIRYLPLPLQGNHLMGPAIATGMADSPWVEQTLPTVPVLAHDKHLEATLGLQPVNPMCQPGRLPANVAVAVEGSWLASTAPCNKPRPTCLIQPEAAAEGGVRHANPLAAVQMLRS